MGCGASTYFSTSPPSPHFFLHLSLPPPKHTPTSPYISPYHVSPHPNAVSYTYPHISPHLLKVWRSYNVMKFLWRSYHAAKLLATIFLSLKNKKLHLHEIHSQLRWMNYKTNFVIFKMICSHMMLSRKYQFLSFGVLCMNPTHKYRH